MHTIIGKAYLIAINGPNNIVPQKPITTNNGIKSLYFFWYRIKANTNILNQNGKAWFNKVDNIGTLSCNKFTDTFLK